MQTITGTDALDALRRVANGEDPDTVWEDYPHTETATAPAGDRPCSYGCGLAAAPGDIYCPGCRGAADEDRQWPQ